MISIFTFPALLAIVFRHAGYAYSGPTQAWAYKYMKYTQEE